MTILTFWHYYPSPGCIKITDHFKLWKNTIHHRLRQQGGHWIRPWPLTWWPMPIQLTSLLWSARDLCHGSIPWAPPAPWVSLLIRPKTWPHWLDNLRLTSLPERSVVNTIKKWQGELGLRCMKTFLRPYISPSFSFTFSKPVSAAYVLPLKLFDLWNPHS